MDTRELAEQSVERAIAAANNNEANIARAIMLDIELIEAHAPSMDDATLARAERTIQKLKLRRRTYSERPYRRKP